MEKTKECCERCFTWSRSGDERYPDCKSVLCPCHTPSIEVSKCCGAEKEKGQTLDINLNEQGFCSKCYKLFEPSVTENIGNAGSRKSYGGGGDNGVTVVIENKKELPKGVCSSCWGKGFYTQMVRYASRGDFIGDKGFDSGSKIEKHTCPICNGTGKDPKVTDNGSEKKFDAPSGCQTGCGKCEICRQAIRGATGGSGERLGVAGYPESEKNYLGGGGLHKIEGAIPKNEKDITKMLKPFKDLIDLHKTEEVEDWHKWEHRLEGSLEILIILAEAVYMSNNKRDVEIGDKMLSEIHTIQHDLKFALSSNTERVKKACVEQIEKLKVDPCGKGWGCDNCNTCSDDVNDALEEVINIIKKI